jgi:hypothetical protein
MARPSTPRRPAKSSSAAAKAPKKSKISVRSKSAPRKKQEAESIEAAADLNRITVGSRVFAGSPRSLAGRKLDILPDMPDIRDRFYVPHFRALQSAIYPRIAFAVRNQGQDSSCTGYSLAHVIDFLRFREIGGDNPAPVSARMLYEMAKRNDEWTGSAYEGSSIRGALKGLSRNGVCREVTAPDSFPQADEWSLTYEMAKEAKEMRLGAYLRLQPDIGDYHAALNEVGVIYVSAQIHSGWDRPENGAIEPGGAGRGGHAFAIVGYDDTGFWILNSWGPEWGNNGIAHWRYRDWAETVMDAWVLQIGVRAPDAFAAVPKVTPSSGAGLFGFGEPERSQIIGHFINIDEGRYVTDGKYGSPTPRESKETVDRLVSADSNGGKGFDHLVIYAHGGLNSLVDEAKRIKVWTRDADIFGRNKIYNFHLMWGSDFIDEVFDDVAKSASGRVGGFWDFLFEAGLGKAIGERAWRNMKSDAHAAFSESQPGYDGGFVGLRPLLTGLDKALRRPKLHLVGHSAGSIVLGHLLSALQRFGLSKIELGSVHLMAPACTVDFFKTHYGPYLTGDGARKLHDKVYLYNLSGDLELADTVSSDLPLAPYYSHSLLYLVSRAYEETARTPLAGMQIFAGKLPSGPKIEIAYSSKGGALTGSTSHGGFDEDAATLTTIMSRILGSPAPLPPTADELQGY